MKLLDVNVLLAAHRDSHVHYQRARPWLDETVRAGDAFSVPDLVAGSFVRLATNRRVFPDPTTVAEGFAFVRAIQAQPGHTLLAPGRRHLDLFERLCRDGDATGDLAADAQLAALALEHGAELVSFDRDFARFPGLRWTTP